MLTRGREFRSHPDVLNIVCQHLFMLALGPHPRCLRARDDSAQLTGQLHSLRCLLKGQEVSLATHEMEHHVNVVQCQLRASGLRIRFFPKNVEVEGEPVPRYERVAICLEPVEIINKHASV